MLYNSVEKSRGICCQPCFPRDRPAVLLSLGWDGLKLSGASPLVFISICHQSLHLVGVACSVPGKVLVLRPLSAWVCLKNCNQSRNATSFFPFACMALVFLVEMWCCLLFPAARNSWGKPTLFFIQSCHRDCLEFPGHPPAGGVAELPWTLQLPVDEWIQHGCKDHC